MYLLSKFIFWITGWKIRGEVPRDCHKAVMIAAPHTSNWDILFARAAFYLMRVPVKFTIKKEWTKGPVGALVKALGGIAIDRNRKGKSGLRMVEAMINLFDEHEQLVIMVTPEGTRSYAPVWKSGFYRVAMGAGVPILLGFLDYSKKEAGVGPVIIPNGDMQEQMEEIKAFYRTKKGKFPSKGIR